MNQALEQEEDHSSPNGRGYGMTSKLMMFWRKNKHNREPLILLLPDDVLEMCLVRLPLESLMNVRLVCKKLNSFTTTPRFLQMKRQIYQYPWLILSGYDRHPYFVYSNHDIPWMYALDPLRNQWRIIPTSSHTDRYNFSVARIHNGLFLVEGSSKGVFLHPLSLIHNSVWYVNVVTLSWHRMPSMKYPRSVPVVGITQDSISSSTRIKRSSLLIVVGGKGNREEPLYYGEIYDSLTKQWIDIDIQSLPSDFGGASSVQTSPLFPPNFNVYRPQLLSSNGRLFLISRCWLKLLQGNIKDGDAVKKLWELDLADLTWNDHFPSHSDAHLDWACVVFAADRKPNSRVHMIKHGLSVVYNYVL
ncbi:F-box/kelch-repeat protein [Trifolium medium]|uniref:F-box/kelch-repeat protein n=1 Tax=Trifolium medium TaxID=97028 RepID=A0A392MS58_9FABA|nr:F-box/kelch-repeat protein [Trifolium medium]